MAFFLRRAARGYTVQYGSTHNTQPAAQRRMPLHTGRVPASESGLLHEVPSREAVLHAGMLAPADVAHAKATPKLAVDDGELVVRVLSQAPREYFDRHQLGDASQMRASCSLACSASSSIAVPNGLPASLRRQVTKLETLLDQLTPRAAGLCEPACSRRVGQQHHKKRLQLRGQCEHRQHGLS